MPGHSLEINDVTVSYNRVPALHHLNLQLACGHCIGLLGPNGAGKTTFLKAIAGLVPLETGEIKLHGMETQRSSREISYLPQRELVDWDFPVTVRGLVEMGRYPELGLWRPFSRRDDEIVDQALDALHLAELADRQINALSGGQQQRVFLARCWAQQAHVYLLDEPFNGLDKNAQEDLRDALQGLARQGKLIVASHHNLKNVPELFDHVILLNGELVATGTVASAFTPQFIDRAYATGVFTGHSHELAD
jgi:ABC-type Mn2+/Zn2+ transport system ATPase subunit